MRVRVAAWVIGAVLLAACGGSDQAAEAEVGVQDGGAVSGAGGAEAGASAGAGGRAGASAGASGRAGAGAGADGRAGAGGASGEAGGGGEDGDAGGAGGGVIPAPSADVDEPNLGVLAWNGHAAAVSLTFDDADPTHYDLAGPVLAERDTVATFFIVSDTIESIGDAARNGFAGLRDQGHELANHTRTHTGSSAGTASEVTDCDAYIESTFDVTAYTFAYPNVDVTATYADAAAALYVASRGGGAGEHVTLDATPDWHNLPSLFVSDPENDPGFTAQVDEARAAIDETLAAGAWRIFTFHGIGPNGWYANTSPSNLGLIVDHLAGKDLWVDTFARVAGYLRAQHALEDADARQDGAGVTWTWTLPPGVRPELRLRVVVDGGTLTQDGTALEWDGDAGYYPVDPSKLELRWAP